MTPPALSPAWDAVSAFREEMTVVSTATDLNTPALFEGFPRMAPASDRPAWRRRVILRGVDTLPVTRR